MRNIGLRYPRLLRWLATEAATSICFALLVQHIIAIQSIIRGFLGRCLAKRRRLEARHLSVIRYVRRLLRDGVYSRARLVYLQRVAAATHIQKCGRGYVTRRIIGEMRSWARKQVLMAVRIQVR